MNQKLTQIFEGVKKVSKSDYVFSENGKAYLVWHNIQSPPKDAGCRLLLWIEEWQETQTIVRPGTELNSMTCS